jgi:tetratricopeptide (TPR) repeat protein
VSDAGVTAAEAVPETAVAAAPAPRATPHLRAGAGHFRAGRFAEALVEFRVADTLGEAPEAAWYVAATLTKLERPAEALEAFSRAEARAPGGRDALLLFYRALACHALRLYGCADAALASAGSRVGPTVAGHAARMREELAALRQQEPSREAVDWYLSRAAEAEGRGQQAVAAAFRQEAEGLARRRADCYRCGSAGAPPARTH